MAVIPATLRRDSPFQGDVLAYEWLNVTEADTCEPVNVPKRSDKSVHVDGNFGTGGAIVWEGSLDVDDGAAYVTLSDPQGNPLSFGVAGLQAVLQNVYRQRPRVSAGTGVSVTIYMLAR